MPALGSCPDLSNSGNLRDHWRLIVVKVPGWWQGFNEIGTQMDSDEIVDQDVTRIGKFASNAFLKIEVFAYLVLGILLAVTALLGIISAAVSLWKDVQVHISANSLVLTIDRLLFVLMVVEILHTVRVSFRSGTLVSEPFLIVGLIASIRRVLVITLESSQVNQAVQHFLHTGYSANFRSRW